MTILTDFKALEKLKEVNISSLIDFLNKEIDFKSFDRTKFEELCEECKIKQEDGYKIANILSFASTKISESRNLSIGKEKLKQFFFQSQDVPAEHLETWNKLNTILDGVDEFILKIKELNLLSQNRSLNYFTITCDIRPLFDLKRNQIKKFLFPILLTINDSKSGNNLTYELDREILEKIKDEAECAIKKLEILKNNMFNS